MEEERKFARLNLKNAKKNIDHPRHEAFIADNMENVSLSKHTFRAIIQGCFTPSVSLSPLSSFTFFSFSLRTSTSLCISQEIRVKTRPDLGWNFLRSKSLLPRKAM